MENIENPSDIALRASVLGQISVKYFVPFYVLAQDVFGKEKITREEFIHFVIEFPLAISKKCSVDVNYCAGLPSPLRVDTRFELSSSTNIKSLIFKALTIIFVNYNQIYTQKVLSAVDEEIFKGITDNAQLQRHSIFHPDTG